MKKYLMTGVAALAMCAGFTSCSHDDDIEVYTQEQITNAKYKQAFETAFGTVNPNVNWGFDNQTVYTFDAEGKFTGTRGTRGVNANGNEWGLYVEVPQPLTDNQKNVVRDWFKANQNPQGVAVNWSDFFVQQVYKGEWGSNMNYLYCGSETDHTYNFNAGDAGVYGNVCYGLQPGATDNNQRVYGSDKIEFMVNSSTEYFGFHNSFDSNFYIDNYVIIPGDIIDPSVAGMYFVGFDFEANGQSDNQKVARDYYFDNWIVKITPGFYKNSKRVMVEDLIDSSLDKVDISDWDFNDAVFDVAFYTVSDWSTGSEIITKNAVVTLWAAGGTKSLTIDGKEVHAMFGQPLSKMINTNAANGIDGLAPVIFRVTYPSEPNANLIPVYVNNTELKATKGEATQKFACSNTTRWMKERKLITGSYTKFKEYVKNNAPTDWYNTVTNTGDLY